jgi:putative spermidine/putrescine transport system permease protein
MESKGLRAALRIWVGLVLAFLFVPIALIVLYAFNPSNIQTWPITGFTLHWFSVAWHDPQVRSAFLLSVRVGLVATVLAMLLGSAVAFALHKFRFFGRDAISFLLVLPIALPGLITGIALNSFFSFTGIQLGTLTIVIGHTTFCIVVAYNNLIARLRRLPVAGRGVDGPAARLADARLVTLPMAATALVSGATRVRPVVDEVIATVSPPAAEHAAVVDLRRNPARPAATRGERGGDHRHRADDRPGGPRGAVGCWLPRRRWPPPRMGVARARRRGGQAHAGGRGAGHAACVPRPFRRGWPRYYPWLPRVGSRLGLAYEHGVGTGASRCTGGAPPSGLGRGARPADAAPGRSSPTCPGTASAAARRGQARWRRCSAP